MCLAAGRRVRGDVERRCCRDRCLSDCVRLSNRQGLQTGSPDEVAFLNGWIDRAALLEQAARFAKNDYGKYLQQIAND
jgi:dTDP-glucose pyrophosphorylase